MNSIALAGLLAIAAAAPAAAQQPPVSIQQEFDAAAAALEANRFEEALRLFEALEASAANPLNRALVRVRKGEALLELGRFEEAEQTVRSALPLLPAADPALRLDRFLALMTLGRIAEALLDYAAAQPLYREASALPVGEDNLILVYRGLIQTRLFDDPLGAIRDADTALAMVGRLAPGQRNVEGQFRTLKGRALLNLGRHAEARAELEAAMRLLGNLTLRVDHADLIARGDLALAALLVGDANAARRYLAYTGAGRFEGAALSPTGGSRPPRCGEHGLLPDDVAVVEAAVSSEGTVSQVMPVYASRPGDAALVFARAVAGWTFDAERAAAVPALLRVATRIELRCTMEEPQPLPGDADDLSAWAAAAGAGQPVQPRLHSRWELAALRREAAAIRPADAASRLRLLDLLSRLGRHAAVPPAERIGYLDRALALAVEARAPGRLVGGLILARAQAALPSRERHDAIDYEPLRSLPEARENPGAVALIRLGEAYAHYRERRDRPARAIVGELRGAAEVEADPLLRRSTLELAAALHAEAGETAAARAALEAIGPDARRCAIPQRMRRSPASSRDFPNEALRWGFEGWTSNEVAVDSAGRVGGARTIAAYPPFVFSEAGRRIAARTRYEPAPSPDGQPCARVFRITFRIAE